MNAERRKLENLIEESIRRQKARHPQKTAFGTYWEINNGILLQVHDEAPVIDNTLPVEGIKDCLNTWLGATAKAGGHYLGLYANAIAPAASWTAANIAGTAGEINDDDEGYSQATRPQYTPNVAASSGASGFIDNVDQEAVFTIVTASELLIEGAFLISDNARGGTAGKLCSAARYTTTRHLQNGDSYRLGFRVTIVGT